MHKEIINDECGIRLDAYLKKNIDELSRAKIQKLINNRNVRVDNFFVKPSYKLRGGESIKVIYELADNKSNILKENIPIDVIYEDESIIIINKKSGMVVHPGAGNHKGTLLNALVYHFSKLSALDVTRPGIIHRLDKDTSGIIIIAKTDEAHYKLGEQFASRKVKKTYRAIVWGKIIEDGKIEGLIARNKHNRKAFALSNSNGKHSLSNFHLLRNYQAFSYVELYPLTGRTHQLRVHMKSIGHPILADPIYGGDIKMSNSFHGKYKNNINKIFNYIDRTALHAYKIEFFHPISKEKVIFEAKLPEDISSCISILENSNE